MKNVSYKINVADHFIDTNGKHLTAGAVMVCHILELLPGKIILQPKGTNERYTVMNERFI